MAFKIAAPFVAACMLAGCVTADTGATRVDSWQGLDVREMIPPLDLAAAANVVVSQGRVVRGGRRDGGAYVLIPAAELATACASRINVDAGPLVGCTIRNVTPSGYVYTVYVAEDYPNWYRELVGTREFGHVGQSEYGRPVDLSGFTSPSMDLIRRLGG